MRYCKRCVQPDTRPGIYFSENGICGACLWKEEDVDWDSRHKELVKIAEDAKKKGRDYDCAVGVSGGKDSTFQALYARDVLGLRTLLVNSEPEGITDVGRYNIENLKQQGFDVISLRPNPRLMKQLIKRDFYKHLNPIKITEHSLYASTYIVADNFDIPLIIQGENIGLSYGTSRTGLGVGGDALKACEGDTIKGGIQEYIDDGFSKDDLYLFHYDADKLRKKGTVGVWMNYYVKDYSPQHNLKFSQQHGLKIRPKDINLYNLGTYNRFSQMDCIILEVNQLFKYEKYGFGQTTDHVCADIRYSLITRDEGIALVREFDGKCGKEHIDDFCDLMEIDEAEFWRVVHKFRGNMWGRTRKRDWKVGNPIWEQGRGWERVDVSEVIQKIREFEASDGFIGEEANPLNVVMKYSRQMAEIKAQEERVREVYQKNLKKLKKGKLTSLLVSQEGIEISE